MQHCALRPSRQTGPGVWAVCAPRPRPLGVPNTAAEDTMQCLGAEYLVSAYNFGSRIRTRREESRLIPAGTCYLPSWDTAAPSPRG